jgi:large subunit ribosomal protein L22
MKIRAEQKYSRQTPRKVRTVANQVKDLGLTEALEQLALMERKAAIVIMKVMRQAVANATNNHGLKLENLELNNILVKKGPTYKRYRAVSRGRGHRILKRSCHVEVTLKTKESKKAEKKDKKKEKQSKNKK